MLVKLPLCKGQNPAIDLCFLSMRICVIEEGQSSDLYLQIYSILSITLEKEEEICSVYEGNVANIPKFNDLFLKHLELRGPAANTFQIIFYWVQPDIFDTL